MNDRDGQTIITRADVGNLFGPPPVRVIPDDLSDDEALEAFVRRLFAAGEDD